MPSCVSNKVCVLCGLAHVASTVTGQIDRRRVSVAPLVCGRAAGGAQPGAPETRGVASGPRRGLPQYRAGLNFDPLD